MKNHFINKNNREEYHNEKIYPVKEITRKSFEIFKGILPTFVYFDQNIYMFNNKIKSDS